MVSMLTPIGKQVALTEHSGLFKKEKKREEDNKGGRKTCRHGGMSGEIRGMIKNPSLSRTHTRCCQIINLK